MHCFFVVQVKCTIFWLNGGFRVHFDLYVQDFSKTTCHVSKWLESYLFGFFFKSSTYISTQTSIKSKCGVCCVNNNVSVHIYCLLVHKKAVECDHNHAQSTIGRIGLIY